MKRSIKTVKDDFAKIARMTQPQLKTWLKVVLENHGYTPIDGDGYLYARGDVVLLTSHMDTVHKDPVKKVFTQTYFDDVIISSPQGIGGDDRCGVWCVLDVLPRLLSYGIRPAILFCEDEEIGGVGSGKFCDTEYIQELSKLKYLIQIDRKGYNDAVFYDDDNQDFHKYVERVTGYKTAQGSFSDISNLCPACGISGVNLSCGYYEPHQLTEYVVASEMVHTADVIVKMVRDTVSNDIGAFEYIDGYAGYGAFSGYGTGAFSGYGDVCGMEFIFIEDGAEKVEYYDCTTFYDGIGQLMVDHPTITWTDVQDYNWY